MADGITKDDLVEALEKVFGRAGKDKEAKISWDPRVAKDFEKAMKESVEQIKKSTTFGKQFEGVLRGQRAEYQNTSEQISKLNKEIQELEKEFKETTDGRAKARIIEERDAKVAAKSQIEYATQVNRTRVGLQNFAVGTAEVLNSIVSATFGLAKGLQSGGDGLEAAGNFASSAAQTTGNAISEVGKFMTALGPVIGTVLGVVAKFIPGLRNVDPGRLVKIATVAGVGISGLGVVAEVAGQKMSTLAKEGMDYLKTEMTATNKAFRSITQTGALLGGGMTELRQAAGTAGLDVTMLANVVKESSQNMSQMGIGMGEATRRIAGISGELRRSDLGMQLRNLGYNAEEQASLAASVAANLRAAGDTRVRSDRDVAEMTAKYGKDLKILGDITGQDAKKKMEEARTRAMEQDLLAQAMARGGPEAMEKLRNQLATMPDVMKKGYLEFVSSGGEAITDVATNVMLQQNPRLMEQYQTMFATLGDSTKTASDALTETGRLTEQTVKYARDNADATREIAVAARLAGTQTTQSVTDFNNALIRASTTFGEGVTDGARTAADKLEKTFDPLTKNINALSEQMDAFRSQLATNLTNALTTYVNSVRAGAETIDQALERMGFKKAGEAASATGSAGGPGKGEMIGQTAGELAGGLVGTTAGAVLGRAATTKIGAAIGTAIAPGIGTAIGAGVGFLAGGLIGNLTGKLGAWIGKKFDKGPGDTADAGSVADVPMAATGNILTGPMKGYFAMLHGTEAVVPLPDGRRIPVNLDFSDFNKATSAQMDMTDEAVNKVYESNRRIQDNFNTINTQMKASVTDEGRAEAMMQDQLRMLSEIRNILETSNSLQQQYVYNTYK